MPLELLALGAAPAAERARGGFAAVCSHTAVCLRLNRLLHMRRVAVYHGKDILRLTRMRRLVVFWMLFFVLAHWVATLFWVIEAEAFGNNVDPYGRPRTPVTPLSPPAQQYWTAMYWSITTLLRVPWVSPSGGGARLYTSAATILGAIAFAFFNGEVHAIVRNSLGLTLKRTQNISDLRTLFHKAQQGGLTRRTAIEWSTAAVRPRPLLAAARPRCPIPAHPTLTPPAPCARCLAGDGRAAAWR